ncbi:MAG: ABC transporter permease [Acidisphaera sp.]|nr:ABC transporter permease [Acidisphaera sp.]
MAVERDWNRRLASKAILAGAVLFLAAPFVVVLGASFDPATGYHVAFPPRGFSLASYAAIPWKYARAAGTSVMVGVIVAVVSTAIGLCAALGLVRGRLIGREALASFFRMPVQIPFVVTGAVFLQFYYQLASLTGVNLLNGLTGLIIAHVFVAVPYSVGAVTAVLSRFDPALEEAAESLGATAWATFRSVTLPIIRPGVLAGLFYAFIVSFGDIPVALFLAPGDRATLPVQIFEDMQFDFKPSMLAVSSLIAVLSLAAILAARELAGFDMVARPAHASAASQPSERTARP